MRRPDGMAIAQVPIARNLTRAIEADESAGEGELLKNFGHIDALRMYGLDDPEKLKKAGFSVGKRNAFEESWVPNAGQHGLDPREDLYVALK